MPGGRRNPIQISQLVGTFQSAMSLAKTEVKDAAAALTHEGRHFVDLTIKFIGASGLPKMDVVGSADPYFIAKLDDRLSFVYVRLSRISQNISPAVAHARSNLDLTSCHL